MKRNENKINTAGRNEKNNSFGKRKIRIKQKKRNRENNEKTNPRPDGNYKAKEIKMDIRMRRKLARRGTKGQAIVEYIIIVVIVAVAALTVLSIFSDAVRQKIAGVASIFGADNAEDAASTNSAEVLKNLEADGSGVDFSD